MLRTIGVSDAPSNPLANDALARASLVVFGPTEEQNPRVRFGKGSAVYASESGAVLYRGDGVAVVAGPPGALADLVCSVPDPFVLAVSTGGSKPSDLRDSRAVFVEIYPGACYSIRPADRNVEELSSRPKRKRKTRRGKPVPEQPSEEPSQPEAVAADKGSEEIED